MVKAETAIDELLYPSINAIALTIAEVPDKTNGTEYGVESIVGSVPSTV
jgi:hypothetical protein